MRHIGENSEELAAVSDHGLALAGACVEVQQLGVQFGTFRRGGEFRVQHHEERGRARTMEIRDGTLFLLRESRGWRGCVQDQGEDAVQIPGAIVHGGNVPVHGQFPGAKLDRTLWRREQEVGQCTQRLLLGVIHAFAVIERKVITSRLRVCMDVFQQARTDVELLPCPL